MLVKRAAAAGKVRVRARSAIARASAAPPADACKQTIEARGQLMKYLLSVINDKRAPARRRDEAAFNLSKIVATPIPRASGPIVVRPPREAKPRTSTYVSKKKQADAAARTAQKGSSWSGLVNGNADHDDDDDGEGDEA